MLTPPPFKLATSPATGLGTGAPRGPACCDADATRAGAALDEPQDVRHGRMKLPDLDTHFQCSVIGTCMTTAALRKVMSRFIHVQDVSDLDIHHEAVLLASQPGPASRALHKALDHQHGATLLRFSRVAEMPPLPVMWEEALRSGDIPGAYWAVLTHRHATTELRNKVFGDVHMLSHLVGAANRADIRRLVALEQANAELREQVEQYQLRHLDREQEFQHLQRELAETRRSLPAAPRLLPASHEWQQHMERVRVALEQVALQTQRREAAEQAAGSAHAIAAQMVEEVTFLRRHAATLAAELGAAEEQLKDLAGDAARLADTDQRLAGRRVLYVGGRPSSTPSIRAFVERHGGEFRHHDGGLEDRKGLLAAGVAWAGLVVFPVDCVDHDSVGNLKRLCVRHGIEFWPLRSAGIGSLAAALAARSGPVAGTVSLPQRPPRHCPKQG